MSTALIGCTGFVGGNLDRSFPFDHRYHSRNIHEIDHQQFDLVVCAGVRAEKWKANQDPEGDRLEIRRLYEHLNTIRTNRLVLISTIDVYPAPCGVDENSLIDVDTNHAYGRHRYQLEEQCRQRFNTCTVRLPALFGSGLKKNAVYDLLNNHRVEFINANCEFQFYDLNWLWHDLTIALNSNLEIVNLATEPLGIARIADIVFDRELEADPETAGLRYDIRTVHAKAFNREGPYLRDQDEVLIALRRFVEDIRSEHGKESGGRR